MDVINWQVIFKILNDDGVVRDYCREQPPFVEDFESEYMMRSMTEAEVQDWAEKMRVQYKLHSFKIERWN